MATPTTSKMAEALTRATSAVTSATTVIDSAIRLTQSLAPLLRQSAGDVDAINSLASELDSRATLLAQAVAANTIAEGAEEPVAMGGSGAGVTRTPEVEPVIATGDESVTGTVEPVETAQTTDEPETGQLLLPLVPSPPRSGGGSGGA